MAISNATRLSDFGSGIGTQGAILKVDNTNKRVGYLSVLFLVSIIALCKPHTLAEGMFARVDDALFALGVWGAGFGIGP